MTLLVAMANSKFAVLLADRRLSCQGRVVHDDYNKLTVLFMEDARMAIAFTGLATWDSWDTADWLLNVLGQLRKIYTDISSLLAALLPLLDQAISALAAPDRRLTVMFCGFTYWGGTPEPKAYLLTNWEHGANQTFTQVNVPPGSHGLVEVGGQSVDFVKGAAPRLRHLVSNGELTPAELLRFAVTHLRRAAGKGGESSIGQQCNSAVIPAAPNSTVTHTYQSAFATGLALGCNIVMPGMTVQGTQIYSPDQPLSGPDIRKKDPCFCGSGRQFKACHLKDFGAVRVQTQMFASPLPWLVSTQQDEVNWPAGGYLAVSSAYA